jgi:hypothetical protein
MIMAYKPTVAEPAVASVELAARPSSYVGGQLTIIDNGKPRAQALMRLIADQLCKRLDLSELEVYTKGSPAAPIDANVTRMLAARSRLVLTGLGD